MNPSYEYMSRIRREEQAKLLDTRRERATKALDVLTLHGDSHAMLAQIAYAIHPHVGAWDEDACDHLRNALAELIGGDHEAASDAQRHCACGASGCHSRDESKEVDDGMAGGGRGMREDSGDSACERMGYSDIHQEVVGLQYDVLGNERHKAVCELSGISVGKLVENYDYVDIYPEFMWAVGQAIGLRHGAGFEEIISRLIYLLGDDQSHDTSPMRQENETGVTDEPDNDERYVLDTSKAKTIGRESDVSEGDDGMAVTKELREWVLRRETVEDVLMSMPPQTQRRLTYKGNRLLEMADDIDGRTEAMRKERDEYHKEMVDAYGIAATFYEECRMYFDLLRDAARDYKTLDRMSAETSANFHAMRDRVWGLEAERDELITQNDILRDKLDELSTSGATELYKLLKRTVGDAKQIADKLNAHNGMLKESERLRRENAEYAADAINKACMYLDLLRDAARDYKALQDKLNHVVKVCQSYIEAKGA